MEILCYIVFIVGGAAIFVWITTITTPTRFVICTALLICFLFLTIYRCRDKIPPYAYYVIDEIQPCLMVPAIGNLHYHKISNFKYSDYCNGNAFLIDSIKLYKLGDTIVMLDTYVKGYPEYWKKGQYDVSKLEWIMPN